MELFEIPYSLWWCFVSKFCSSAICQSRVSS